MLQYVLAGCKRPLRLLELQEHLLCSLLGRRILSWYMFIMLQVISSCNHSEVRWTLGSVHQAAHLELLACLLHCHQDRLRIHDC